MTTHIALKIIGIINEDFFPYKWVTVQETHQFVSHVPSSCTFATMKNCFVKLACILIAFHLKIVLSAPTEEKKVEPKGWFATLADAGMVPRTIGDLVSNPHAMTVATNLIK